MPNKGHQASQTLAAEQARKKSAELSKVGVLSMSLVINNGESSPEVSSEEEFAQWCWQVLEDNGVRDKYQQILMLKGRHLNHFNNRADKIATMQELCNSRLPPFPIPLDEMTDYTTVKNCFNAMFTAEGFKEDWKVGDNPPASVVSWWGESNWDIFSQLSGQEISPATTKLIRSRLGDSAIGFLKKKLRECYTLR